MFTGAFVRKSLSGIALLGASLTASAQVVIESIPDAPIETRISHLVARLFFRGIYFPQMGTLAWLKLLFQNRGSIFSLAREGFQIWRKGRRPSTLAVAGDTGY